MATKVALEYLPLSDVSLKFDEHGDATWWHLPTNKPLELNTDGLSKTQVEQLNCRFNAHILAVARRSGRKEMEIPMATPMGTNPFI
jgi:hypothetical protein